MTRTPAADVARTEKLFTRVEPEVVERLDALAKRIAETLPAGLTVTRADVARMLLLEGLERHEAQDAPKRGRKQ